MQPNLTNSYQSRNQRKAMDMDWLCSTNDKHYIINIVLQWTPAEGEKRGRPKDKWRRTIENELRRTVLTWRKAERKAQDRQYCRALEVASCASTHE